VRHLALVHARNNKCDVCNKVFASGVDLQRHNLLVHNAPPGPTAQAAASRQYYHVLGVYDMCARDCRHTTKCYVSRRSADAPSEYDHPNRAIRVRQAG
jgi:hypothetical protein